MRLAELPHELSELSIINRADFIASLLRLAQDSRLGRLQEEPNLLADFAQTHRRRHLRRVHQTVARKVVALEDNLIWGGVGGGGKEGGGMLK